MEYLYGNDACGENGVSAFIDTAKGAACQFFKELVVPDDIADLRHVLRPPQRAFFALLFP